MKKKGFATSAILYTLLLLFLVLMVGILNNLQNKKTILDALKKDTIQALENGTVTDVILDQIGIINSKIVEIEAKINDYEANTYTKTEIDNMLHSTPLQVTGVSKQSDIDGRLNDWSRFPNWSCTKEYLNVNQNGLSLEGGAWVVETCRSNVYGYQIATKYEGNLKQLPRLERSYIDGTWSSWKNPHTANEDVSGVYSFDISFGNLQGGQYSFSNSVYIGDLTNKRITVITASLPGMTTLTDSEIELLNNYKLIRNNKWLSFQIVNNSDRTFAQKVSGYTVSITVVIEDK